jgi:hypothetical protein
MSPLRAWRARGRRWRDRRQLRRAERQMRMRVGGEPPPERTLALAFEQLCRQLERPFSATEIRAAAPPDDGRSMTLGGLLLAAERLGFKSREIEASPRNLAAMPPPFLLVGRRPGAGWLVRSRTGDHLVVVEPGGERSSALSLETVADMAARAVLLKPLANPAPQQAVERIDPAPAQAGGLGARPRVGGDQPSGARDADLPDDRVQQGRQPIHRYPSASYGVG